MLPIILVIVGLVVLIGVGLKYATPRATPLSPTDPLWIEAVGRARSTLPEMFSLLDAGHEVWVKFPVETSDAPEHVWARVITRSGDTLQCRIETPTIARSGQNTADLQVDAIEDWQVELEDGTVRGGFTTLAQMAIAKRDGHVVPKHVREIASRIRN